jgi:hypothetical protein
MKKNDYKFHRDKKDQVKDDARESDKSFWAEPTPIFIPRRKKFKRK